MYSSTLHITILLSLLLLVRCQNSIYGDFFANDASCSGTSIGKVSIVTGKCFSINSEDSFRYSCNGTTINFYQCSDASCGFCTPTSLPQDFCIQLPRGSNLLGYAKISCQVSPILPAITTGGTRFNVFSNTSCVDPFQTIQVNQGCVPSTTTNGSRSYQCYEGEYKVTDFTSNDCTTGGTTTTRSVFECSSFLEVTQCSTLTSAVATVNATGQFFYDSNCVRSAGRLVVPTNILNQGRYVGTTLQFLCLGTNLIERQCSSYGCSDSFTTTFNQTCNNVTTDENNLQLYLRKPSCGNLSLFSKFTQFLISGCGTSPITVYRDVSTQCQSTDGLTSRIYGCNSTTTFYQQFNSLDCSGSSTFTTVLQRDQCAANQNDKFVDCVLSISCYGIVSTDPRVCSGNGLCLSQDQCTCLSTTFTGLQCEIPVFSPNNNTVANITTNLNSVNLVINNGSSINIQAQNISISNSSFIVEGSMNIAGSTVTISSSTIQISEGGGLIISSNSILIGTGNSTLQSSGTVQVVMGSQTTVILIPIVNSGTFQISGSGNINLTNSITQSPTATFQSLDSNITVVGNLNIKSGFVNLGGRVTSANVNITDSFLKIPKGLELIGNLNLNSTTIFEVSSITNLNQLLISKDFNLYSTVFLKLTKDFVANVGQELNIIPQAQKMLLNGNFRFIGSSDKTTIVPTITDSSKSSDYLNGDILQISSQKLKLEVAYTIGDASSVCHYLGIGKNLEYNVMDLQIAISLVLPIPKSNVNFGIGWNTNDTFDVTKAVLFANDTVQKSRSFSLIDSTLRKVPQLFGIGPSYYYANIILFRNTFNQTHLFYIETTGQLNDTSKLTIEKFKFQIGVDKSKDCTNFIFPFRAEVYSIAGTTVLLAFYIFLFIVSAIFSILKAQPMVSRGISPFYVLFFCFAQLLTEIRSYFYNPNEQASLCLFYSYLYYPSLQTCYIIILFYYVRYFMIINMNETKNTYSDATKEGLERAKKKIFCMKLFLSRWTIVGYILATYLLVNVFLTIILSTTLYVCSYQILLVIKIFHTLSLLVVYTLTIASIFFDVLINYEKILRCKWINFIFYSDPFWFRTQVLLFFIYLIYQFVMDVVVLTRTSTYVANLNNHYLLAISNTVSNIFLVLIDVVFPLIITIFYYIYFSFSCDINCKRKPCCIVSIKKKTDQTKNELLNLLNDPKGRALFEEFCKSEFSVENMSAYKDIEKFKTDPNEQLAKEIYQNYLNQNSSPMEINVPKSLCTDVLKKMEVGIPADLFDGIEAGLMVNLTDTFFRFQETAIYKNYKLRNEAQTSLLGYDLGDLNKRKTTVKKDVELKEIPLEIKKVEIQPVEVKKIEEKVPLLEEKPEEPKVAEVVLENPIEVPTEEKHDEKVPLIEKHEPIEEKPLPIIVEEKPIEEKPEENIIPPIIEEPKPIEEKKEEPVKEEPVIVKEEPIVVKEEPIEVKEEPKIQEAPVKNTREEELEKKVKELESQLEEMKKKVEIPVELLEDNNEIDEIEEVELTKEEEELTEEEFEKREKERMIKDEEEKRLQDLKNAEEKRKLLEEQEKLLQKEQELRAQELNEEQQKFIEEINKEKEKLKQEQEEIDMKVKKEIILNQKKRKLYMMRKNQRVTNQFLKEKKTRDVKMFHLLYTNVVNDRVSISEIPPKSENISNYGSYVLYHDDQSVVFVWIGSKSSNKAKMKASVVAQNIKNTKKGGQVIRIEDEEDENSEQFWNHLGGKSQAKDHELSFEQKEFTLFKIMLNEKTGKPIFTKFQEEKIYYPYLQSKFCYIIDVNDHIYYWQGSEAPEKLKEIGYTHTKNYQGFSGKLWVTLEKVEENHEGNDFFSLIPIE